VQVRSQSRRRSVGRREFRSRGRSAKSLRRTSPERKARSRAVQRVAEPRIDTRVQRFIQAALEFLAQARVKDPDAAKDFADWKSRTVLLR